MTREKLLSVLDIAEKLNTGKATIKFMLRRFKKWLPYELINGQPFYHPDETVKRLFIIQESLNMGMLPSNIEKKMDDLGDLNSDDLLNNFVNPSQNEDIRLSNDGLNLLKSLFHDIGEQQKRIAIAHEKRAEVEERKADAIEKRAEAEEKKADAMNNIANALQEMNRLRADDPAARQIAHQAVSIIAADETDKENFSFELDDLSTLIQEPNDFDEIDPDLSSLLEEDNIPDEFDNLSLLLNEIEESDNKIDDLSKLIDEAPLASAESVQLDDLSLLLDTSSPVADDIPKDQEQTDQPLALDDLSALIEQTDEVSKTEPSIEIDDLSKLIDDSSDSGQKAQDLDDLSLLITDDSLQMDDLSKLIDDPETIEESSLGKDEPENEPKDTPAIKIDISPEEDLEKYKAAVMKIIIELKNDGLDVEETTNRLNKNKIKTLSGKPEWGQKAISQIYKFIESAK